MEILFQSKTCVFMDDVLMIKGVTSPFFMNKLRKSFTKSVITLMILCFTMKKIKNARCRFHSTIKKMKKLF